MMRIVKKKKKVVSNQHQPIAPTLQHSLSLSLPFILLFTHILQTSGLYLNSPSSITLTHTNSFNLFLLILQTQHNTHTHKITLNNSSIQY